MKSLLINVCMRIVSALCTYKFTDSVRSLQMRHCHETHWVCTDTTNDPLHFCFTLVCVRVSALSFGAINTLLSCQIVELMTESAMILFVICSKLSLPSSHLLNSYSLTLFLSLTHTHTLWSTFHRTLRGNLRYFHQNGESPFPSPFLCFCVWEWKCKTKQLNTHRSSHSVFAMELCCTKEFISLLLFFYLSMFVFVFACSLNLLSKIATFINSNDAPNELSQSVIVILIILLLLLLQSWNFESSHIVVYIFSIEKSLS